MSSVTTLGPDRSAIRVPALSSTARSSESDRLKDSLASTAPAGSVIEYERVGFCLLRLPLNVRTSGATELVDEGLSLGVGPPDGELDEVFGGDGLVVDELGVGGGAALEEGVGLGERVGAKEGDEAPRARSALYAFTRPYCTLTVDPPCVTPEIGSTLENSASLSCSIVAFGAKESINARVPETTGAEIDVPPTAS
jgi:hypothetical protein